MPCTRCSIVTCDATLVPYGLCTLFSETVHAKWLIRVSGTLIRAQEARETAKQFRVRYENDVSTIGCMHAGCFFIFFPIDDILRDTKNLYGCICRPKVPNSCSVYPIRKVWQRLETSVLSSCRVLCTDSYVGVGCRLPPPPPLLIRRVQTNIRPRASKNQLSTQQYNMTDRSFFSPHFVRRRHVLRGVCVTPVRIEAKPA